MAVGPGDCPDLVALREHIGECQRCPLSKTRTKLVFGSGDPDAALMFVGEGPGRNEDLQGEPFVGAAGSLLDELLASIGLHRGRVYIANMVKCRPPGNRDPLPLELDTCAPFLDRQIELIDPKIVCTLGKFAAQHVLDTTAGIMKLRGKLYRVGGRRIVPILHPAAALHNGSYRELLFDDFRRLRTVLERPDEDAVAGSADGDVAAGETTTRDDESAAATPNSHEVPAAGRDPQDEQPTLF